MKIEIDGLTKKNANLPNSFSRFYMGQQKLDKILEIQIEFFDKDDLGYDGSVKETHFKISLLRLMIHMKHLVHVHIVINWVILDNFIP